MASMSTKKILEVQIAANHQHQRREQRDEAKYFNISTGSISSSFSECVLSSIYTTSLFSLLSILFLYTTTRTIFIFFWLDDLLYCIMFSREAEEKGHTLINLCLVTFYRSKISLKKCNRYLRKNNLIYFFNGAFRKRPKVKAKI